MDAVHGPYAPPGSSAPDDLSGWTPCPSCGTTNRAGARFCQACGRSLLGEPADPATARVLTAVVCELSAVSDAFGSFGLPEDGDELLELARRVFVDAGGGSEDLIDAPRSVAVVFGPGSSDGVMTLRAVEAATRARDAVAAAGAGLRVGVGSTEVHDDDVDAVALWRTRVIDLALRLERMASAGDVIISEGVYRLIRDDVDADPVDPRADPNGADVGPLRLRSIARPAPDANEAEEPRTHVASEPEEPFGEVTATDDPSAAWQEAWELPDETEPSPEQPAEVAAGSPYAEEWAPVSWGDADVVASAAESDVSTDDADAYDIDLAETYVEPVNDADDAVADADEPVEDDASAHEDEAERAAEESDDADAAIGAEAGSDAVIGAGAGGAEPVGEPARADVPLLGRGEVLANLHDALDRAIETGRPVGVDLAGELGSGRTSVARWFASRTADRAWSVEVSCRPPDRGGTSWPFAPLVRLLAGLRGVTERDEIEARLRGALEGRANADERASTLALYLTSDAGRSPVGEIRAAIAELVSATALRRPLIVIVDDVDRVPDLRPVLGEMLAAVEAPVVALRIGSSGAANDAIVLPPLSDDEAAELVERLLSRPNLPPDATGAIVAACAGNPFAVEELVAMLADDGHLRWEYGRWAPNVDLSSLPLPRELRSLVARRVGGLTEDERDVAAAAAIATSSGEPADQTTIEAASGRSSETVAAALARLVDRGILRHAPDADAFIFGHDALRSAAEEYLRKDVVATAHTAVANALERLPLVGPDIDEAVGAHLELAYRSGGSGEGRDDLGRRASDRLARAARGAADLGDEPASIALLRRAAAVLSVDDAERARLLLDSAEGLRERGEAQAADRLLGDAVRAAHASGDELLEHRAAIARARAIAVASRLEEHVEALRDATHAAIETIRLAGASREPGAAAPQEELETAYAAWSARGWIHAVRGHFAGAADAYVRAADAARERRRDELAAIREVAGAILDGPTPATEAVDGARELLERIRGTDVEAIVEATLAVTLARAGRSEEAGDIAERLSRTAGVGDDAADVRLRVALVERANGSLEAAEGTLRAALGGSLTPARRGAVQALLALVLAEAGRSVEAIETAEAAARSADPDDVASQVTWRSAKARCLAAAGRYGEARALVRLALRLADQTDLSELRARTRLDLAEVLLASGRANEAGPAARSALRSLVRKASVPEAARARAFVDRTSGRPATTTTTAALATTSNAEDDAEAPAASEDTARVDAEAVTVPTDDDAIVPNGDGHASESTDDGERRERRWFW